MTKVRLKDIYQQYINEIENISMTRFAEIIHTSKQNISKKFKNNSCIQIDEQYFLICHLKTLKKTSTNLYQQLDSTNKYLETINKYVSNTICASDNSMSPEINYKDILLMDESQTIIINGSSYVFNYKGEINCRLLYETEDGIMACSKNKDYPPFIIKKTSDFKMLGRVVGVIHSVT